MESVFGLCVTNARICQALRTPFAELSSVTGIKTSDRQESEGEEAEKVDSGKWKERRSVCTDNVVWLAGLRTFACTTSASACSIFKRDTYVVK